MTEKIPLSRAVIQLATQSEVALNIVLKISDMMLRTGGMVESTSTHYVAVEQIDAVFEPQFPGFKKILTLTNVNILTLTQSYWIKFTNNNRFVSINLEDSYILATEIIDGATIVNSRHIFEFVSDKKRRIDRDMAAPTYAAIMFWQMCVFAFVSLYTSKQNIAIQGRRKIDGILTGDAIPHAVWHRFSNLLPHEYTKTLWVDWANDIVHYEGNEWRDVKVFVRIEKLSLRRLRNAESRLITRVFEQYVRNHPYTPKTFKECLKVIKSYFPNTSERQFREIWKLTMRFARMRHADTHWGAPGRPSRQDGQ